MQEVWVETFYKEKTALLFRKIIPSYALQNCLPAGLGAGSVGRPAPAGL